MNKEDFDDWMAHPVTVEVHKYLMEVRENIKELLARGEYTHETCEGTAIKIAEAVARCDVLEQILSLEYEYFNQVSMELDNESGSEESVVY